MITFKAKRPSQEKDKIIKKMQEEEKEEDLRWCQVKIPAKLRVAIDKNRSIHRISLKELMIKIIERYLKDEEERMKNEKS